MGKPYQVLGRDYVPVDNPAYDEVGLASWYGPGFHAKSTANGEVFDQEAVSAAHKTLPIPSYVEVENLENGRRVTLRVNDRGPFVDGRIIDLSRRSAEMLGVYGPGTARVRVRRIQPTVAQVAALKPPRWGKPVQLATAVQAIQQPASPVPPGQPSTPSGTVLIQVAAVTDEGRATWLAGYLSAIAPAHVEKTASGLHRVRMGPFTSREAAAAALNRVRAAGYDEAWILGAPPTLGALSGATPILLAIRQSYRDGAVAGRDER